MSTPIRRPRPTPSDAIQQHSDKLACPNNTLPKPLFVGTAAPNVDALTVDTPVADDIGVLCRRTVGSIVLSRKSLYDLPFILPIYSPALRPWSRHGHHTSDAPLLPPSTSRQHPIYASWLFRVRLAAVPFNSDNLRVAEGTIDHGCPCLFR